MANRVRSITTFGVAMSLMLWMAGAASAYATHHDHHLTYGVTGQKFYLDSTAISRTNAIAQAVNVWNATSTPISYARTYTQSQSRMDFHENSSSGYAFCATTRVFIDTTDVTSQADTTNWWWARVYIDPTIDVASLCGTQTTVHRGSIVAHEMGHGMGLAHTSNAATLMYNGQAGTAVYKPAADDIAGINHLY